MMKVTTLVIIILSLTLLTTVAFGAFYINNQNPVEQVTKAIPVTAPLVTKPEFTYAIYGPKDMSLNYPMAVTVDGGMIYVSDTNSHQVQAFDYNGKLIRTIGAAQEGAEAPIRSPYGLAVDGNRLLVADLDGSRIGIFTIDGDFQGYFKPSSDAGFYQKPGDLKLVDGKLYLTDILQMQVLVYDLDGNLLLSFGEEGTGKGQFSYPNGVAVDQDGNIFVADSGNNRIQVFDPEGNYKYTLGGEEGKVGSLTTARGIAVDRRGNIYVTAGLIGQVFVLKPDGTELFRVGSRGTENGQLNLPNGLFLDSNNRLYVTEVGNNRVSIFK